MLRLDVHPNDLQRLNRLAFAASGLTLEEATGGHTNRQRGSGIDFLDYRPYSAGDDFRDIDWNIYGRLRQLFVRLHETPRQLAINLLIDASRSMGFGSALSKLDQAKRIAFGLGFVALHSSERVSVADFADGLGKPTQFLSGTAAIGAIEKRITATEAAGPSALGKALTQLQALRRHRGLLVILSDFLDLAELETSVGHFLSAGGRILAIQVLDPFDRGHGLTGNLRLRDSETGKLVDVHIDEEKLAAYRTAFETRRAALESFFRRRGQQYVMVGTDESYVEVICQVLRSTGILR